VEKINKVLVLDTDVGNTMYVVASKVAHVVLWDLNLH
jgi:hypothetical protein